VLAVNLLGVWRCLKFEARQVIMRDRLGGCVINSSSMLAEVGMAENAAYTAAKHGGARADPLRSPGVGAVRPAG
jgi:NAD(P)-dependent dehydrogenase (short-subunit alcohol dehydrogenase family)